MIRKAETFAMTILLAAIYSTLAQGQTPTSTTLVIDLQNVIEYQGDIADPSKFATNPNVTPSVQPKNFSWQRFWGILWPSMASRPGAYTPVDRVLLL